MSKALSASVTFEALEARVDTLEASPVFTGNISVGDSSFGLYHSVAINPNIVFDTGDTFGYNRTLNFFGFNIASSTVVSITATSFHVDLALLPIYASNAAAITGGLVAGDCYRTSTGQLMVRY